jgi:hypothetical protein
MNAGDRVRKKFEETSISGESGTVSQRACTENFLGMLSFLEK